MEDRTSLLLQADPLPRLLTKPLGGHGPFCQASSTWYGEGRGNNGSETPSLPHISLPPQAQAARAVSSKDTRCTPTSIFMPTGTTVNERLQMWTHLPLWTTSPTPKLPHPLPTLTYQIDKLIDVQPLLPPGLEDSDNEAVQKVLSLLQVLAIFIFSFQVGLRWDEPHTAPPGPGLLAVISNPEHT